MSLPTPNLDDRKFQDIVDDVKRQIGLRCPDWTDHNVSDPGVTLIELFAWMTEQMLFKLNQVPERNYIKFLELLGVTLESPTPAQTELLFRLSRPIGDQPGDEASERTLKAYETVAATIRTETEEAIEFTLDADLRMRRPKLTHILAVPSPEMSGMPNLLNVREFHSPPPPLLNGLSAAERERQKTPPPVFPLFSPKPIEGEELGEGDALYLGFEADISGNLVRLEADCITAAAVDRNPDYPAQIWEYWNDTRSCWDPLEAPLERDTTKGFTYNGYIELRMPNKLEERELTWTQNKTQVNRRAYWIRCRYTTKLPPRGPENLQPSPYATSPEITRLNASVIGGMAPASNCVVVNWEVLGQSDATAGQMFKLRHAPVLPPREDYGEILLIGAQDASPEEMEAWKKVDDFADSLSDKSQERDDKHYVLDTFTGEIFFGPKILQPDGSAIQHGSIPEKGKTIVFQRYRYGGGVEGNVRENQVRVLKSSIPYIDEVVNPRIAQGGSNLETLERAKMRGRSMLRILDRAVTPEDYETLASQVAKGIRAHCVRIRSGLDSQASDLPIPPGEVRLLIIPGLPKTALTPRPRDLQVPTRILEVVKKHLDERRLLTVDLKIGQPEYIYISSEITLVPDPRVDPDLLRRRVEERLSTYIHPLLGGPNGTGWPFGRALTLADIYAQVAAVSGVAFLLDAHLYTAQVINETEGLLSQEEPVKPEEDEQVGYRIKLANNQMFCSNRHTVRIKAMGAVGREDR